jgi:ATP-dependent DNA helicase RecQ
MSHIKRNKLSKIVDYCTKNLALCGIVYCQTRKSVKEIAKILQVNKVSVGVYHGGMNKDDRNLMLTNWLEGKIKVMVSTNAFGMGIDKPDVRFVLHYEFPPSLEAYFQEAGRAGRDGNESRAIVFWEQGDIDKLIERNENQFPDVETVKRTYRALCNHLKIAIGSGLDETYFFDINTFCHAFNLNPLITYNSFKILELNGDLVFSEGIFNPTKVKFSVGNKELYNFQIQHGKLVGLTTLLSRSYPGVFDSYFEIHEKEFVKRLNISVAELNIQLKQLEKNGILDITWSSSLPSVTLTHERLPDNYLSLSEEVYFSRKENARKKLEAAIGYLTKNECRSSMLIHYFGQEIKPCGKCDVCKIQQNSEYSIPELKTLLLEILKKESTVEECIEKTNASTEITLVCLRELILDGKIQHKNDHYFLK